MDIVIISEFCDDFSKSDNDRFLYLAKMLADKNDVEIITSSFRHTTKSYRGESIEKWPFKITFIEEPGYPQNICLKRFYSHFVWGKRLKKYLASRVKPDVVYCAVPSLTGPNLVAKYCEKKGIRFIIDVQDLWPEAFKMVINIPIISSLLFAPFTILANGIYKRADAICAVSDTYCERAKQANKKGANTCTVYLGTELASFDRYSLESPMLKKKPEEIWLAYCGTLGSSYDITCVIDALVYLSNPYIKLLIMGDGPKISEFKHYAEMKNANVVFVGRIEYSAMCSLLSTCDITINPITHGAAQSIINKHADYAASGLPVISTQESEEYRNLIDKYQMGFNCDNNDSVDLATKLDLLVKNTELRRVMGKNARCCAEENFDRRTTYKSLKEIIIGIRRED